jgi:hypothetical protein
MHRHFQLAAHTARIAILGAAIVSAAGCKSNPAAPAAATPAPKPTLMDATTRATAAQSAAQHPDFKVFLQKIDMPAILVVPENTTDDQLKNLLWLLRIKVREGKFKELGLHPTTTLFDTPGYSSGVINIYRGTRCAKEMYTTSGPDPCGASIHKSASYHWGDGGDPHSDGGDIDPAGGPDTLLFTADDGFQTDEEAAKDPTGSLRKAAVARIHYATAQNAKQTKQHTDIRFYIDQPDDQLNIVSYQLATEAGQQTFLKQLLILDQDRLCPLGFKSIRLGVRGSPGKSYPLDCAATK